MNWNIGIIYSNMCLRVMSNMTGAIVLLVGGWLVKVKSDRNGRGDWPASGEQAKTRGSPVWRLRDLWYQLQCQVAGTAGETLQVKISRRWLAPRWLGRADGFAVLTKPSTSTQLAYKWVFPKWGRVC